MDLIIKLTDKKFAPWSPEEGCPESKNYLDGLKKAIEV